MNSNQTQRSEFPTVVAAVVLLALMGLYVGTYFAMSQTAGFGMVRVFKWKWQTQFYRPMFVAESWAKGIQIHPGYRE